MTEERYVDCDICGERFVDGAETRQKRRFL